MTKKSTKITPLGDRVLIKSSNSNEEKKTSSGIIIPQGTSDDRGSKQGQVVAVGAGGRENGKLVKPSVKEGDMVLFTWGEEVTIDREDYYLVSESNILAIIK